MSLVTTTPYYVAVKAKPTRYKGIRMRSRLEATAARTLDGYEIPWKYEPRIFSRRFRKGTGYKPDFQLWPGSASPWYVEIKPTGLYDRQPAARLRAALDKMSVIRDSEPDAVFVLWLVDSPLAPGGALLINLSGALDWVARPGVFLRQVARAQPPAARRRTFRWRRS